MIDVPGLLISQFIWVCGERGCSFIRLGTAEDAHTHHHEESCWGHWIYQFDCRDRQPTGISIHTSEFEGYYWDDLRELEMDISPDCAHRAFRYEMLS